ncbi:NAD(P)-dependent oxidoreductase [Candidatus Allofournierella excrementigallinarum]|uniref:NAD(P)-dependent oxidoreductase n=1 Tax=Candidatus Allofournierella excrementigallinarum TaxID=2838592 RepID=UPI00374F0FF2
MALSRSSTACWAPRPTFFAIFFTLHLPANAQTKGFMNAGVFRACKPGLRLLNFARGELVNNADLLAALADQLAAIPSVIRVRVL